MSLSQSVIVSFAGSAVAVEFDDPRAGEIIDFLIHPAAIDASKTPHCTFRLEIEDGEKTKYSYSLDGARQYQGTNRGDLAEMLQGGVCRALADKSQGGLLFHSAALANNGWGILIPGGIGAGKSTLTAWLLSKGLDYLTDELVYIPWGSATLQPFTRPLHLKHPSRPVLSSLVDIDYNHNSVLNSSRSDLVPPSFLNENCESGPVPLKVILFPSFQAKGDASWQLLSQAQTGQYLMQSLINARNLPHHGFHEAARLARTIPGYRLTYSHFSEVEKQLDGVLFSE